MITHLPSHAQSASYKCYTKDRQLYFCSSFHVIADVSDTVIGSTNPKSQTVTEAVGIRSLLNVTRPLSYDEMVRLWRLFWRRVVVSAAFAITGRHLNVTFVQIYRWTFTTPSLANATAPYAGGTSDFSYYVGYSFFWWRSFYIVPSAPLRTVWRVKSTSGFCERRFLSESSVSSYRSLFVSVIFDSLVVGQAMSHSRGAYRFLKRVFGPA